MTIYYIEKNLMTLSPRSSIVGVGPSCGEVITCCQLLRSLLFVLDRGNKAHKARHHLFGIKSGAGIYGFCDCHEQRVKVSLVAKSSLRDRRVRRLSTECREEGHGCIESTSGGGRVLPLIFTSTECCVKFVLRVTADAILKRKQKIRDK